MDRRALLPLLLLLLLCAAALPAAAPAGVVQLDGGGDHFCAVTDQGGAVCWGDNDRGQLGNGTRNASPTAPVQVVGLESGVAQVATGQGTSCAVLDDGSVRCWGSNAYNELGNGEGGKGWESETEPVDVAIHGRARLVEVGERHVCVALQGAGGVECWGQNTKGAVGNGQYPGSQDDVHIGVGNPAPTPQHTTGSGPADVSWIGAGTDFTCAAAATLYCWGTNELGRLGLGDQWTDEHESYIAWEPQPVSDLGGRADMVSAGGEFACAKLTSGTIRCWGWGDPGTMGDGAGDDAYAPVTVKGLSDMGTVAAGDEFACANEAFGSRGVWCWGDDRDHQLGTYDVTDPDASGFSRLPVHLKGIGGVVSLAAGRAVACARLQDGTVSCWGGGYGATPQAIAGIAPTPPGSPATTTGGGNGTSLGTGATNPASPPIGIGSAGQVTTSPTPPARPQPPKLAIRQPSLTQTSRASTSAVPRDTRITATLRFAFRLPTGTNLTRACRGQARITASRSITKGGSLVPGARGCRVDMHLRMPRSTRGTTLTFTVTHPGNTVLKPITYKKKLTIA